MKNIINNLFSGLNNREKYLLLFACIFIISAAVYNFGISPVLERQTRSEQQLNAKQNALETLSRLNEEYNSILQKSEQLKNIYVKREKGFTLFAFLEAMAVKAKLNAHIDYMKPSSVADKQSEFYLSLVEMKLKGIKLSQLISFLYLVEMSGNSVFINRLSITGDGKDQATISAALQVGAYVND